MMQTANQTSLHVVGRQVLRPTPVRRMCTATRPVDDDFHPGARITYHGRATAITSVDYARPFAPAGDVIPHRPARTVGPGYRVVRIEDVRAHDRRSSATTELRTSFPGRARRIRKDGWS
jgi:hypothetical protein